MERALRNRLTFGPIMLAVLFLLLWLDDWLQFKTRGWMEAHYAAYDFRGGIGGIGLLLVLAAISPLATDELATLLTAEKVRPYRIISGIGSFLLVLHAFCTQFPPFQKIA